MNSDSCIYSNGYCPGFLPGFLISPPSHARAEDAMQLMNFSVTIIPMQGGNVNFFPLFFAV